MSDIKDYPSYNGILFDEKECIKLLEFRYDDLRNKQFIIDTIMKVPRIDLPEYRFSILHKRVGDSIINTMNVYKVLLDDYIQYRRDERINGCLIK